MGSFMTYRELLDVLNRLPDGRLDDVVTVYVTADQEYFGIDDVDYADPVYNSVLDPDHLFLVLDNK